VIQWIHADNLTLNKSKLRGVGGEPGEIILAGDLTLDDSTLRGKAENQISHLSAGGIALSNKSYLENISGNINVTNKTIFTLESGSMIKEVRGEISSCASLVLDGNTTAITLDPNGLKTIKAKSLILDNNSWIDCFGEEDCKYEFIPQSCGLAPTSSLDLNSAAVGNPPLEVQFVGECDGKGSSVTCTINFGDSSVQEIFEGSISHIYENTGTFTAVLTAESEEGVTGTSEKTITIIEEGAIAPGTEDVQISISEEIIQAGTELTLTVNCNTGFETIIFENDYGGPPVTDVPKICPAIMLIEIPAATLAGTYSFTASGTTLEGNVFTKTIPVTIENTGFSIAGFDMDTIIMVGGGIGLLVIVIVIIVLLFIILKKKGIIKFKKPAAKPVTGKKEPAWAQSEKKAAPAPQPTEDTPPWMVKKGPAKAPAPIPKQTEKISQMKPLDGKPLEKARIVPEKKAGAAKPIASKAMPLPEASSWLTKEEKAGATKAAATKPSIPQGVPLPTAEKAAQPAAKPAAPPAPGMNAKPMPAGKPEDLYNFVEGIKKDEAQRQAAEESKIAKEKPVESAKKEPAKRFQKLVEMLKASKKKTGEPVPGIGAEPLLEEKSKPIIEERMTVKEKPAWIAEREAHEKEAKKKPVSIPGIEKPLNREKKILDRLEKPLPAQKDSPEGLRETLAENAAAIEAGKKVGATAEVKPEKPPMPEPAPKPEPTMPKAEPAPMPIPEPIQAPEPAAPKPEKASIAQSPWPEPEAVPRAKGERLKKEKPVPIPEAIAPIPEAEPVASKPEPAMPAPKAVAPSPAPTPKAAAPAAPKSEPTAGPKAKKKKKEPAEESEEDLPPWLKK